MKFKEINTKDCPTVFTAIDAPCKWVTNIKEGYPVDFEFGSYYEPMKNVDWPNSSCLNGIYIEITRFVALNQKSYYLRCNATRPDLLRDQMTMGKRYQTYAKAKEEAFKWIEKAKKWLALDIPIEPTLERLRVINLTPSTPTT